MNWIGGRWSIVPTLARWLFTAREMIRTALEAFTIRSRKDRRCRAFLAAIDEADLSESGRRIRREVVRELRELKRRTGAVATADREAGADHGLHGHQQRLTTGTPTRQSDRLRQERPWTSPRSRSG
jgi:hypothetical protein